VNAMNVLIIVLLADKEHRMKLILSILFLILILINLTNTVIIAIKQLNHKLIKRFILTHFLEFLLLVLMIPIPKDVIKK